MSFTLAAAAALASGNIDNLIAATTPGGIERQEAAGQAHLVRNADRLPMQVTNRGVTQEDITRETGIVFGEPIDELFVSVTLPAGWRLSATEHSMHNDLLDEQGRVRAGIFYKAAFYDRRASLRFGVRYKFSNDYKEPTSTVSIIDAATQQTIHTIGTCEYSSFEQSDELEKEAEAWLSEHYPDHRNPFSYWK